MSDDRQKLVERYAQRSTKASTTVAAEAVNYQAASPVSANRPPEPMLELRLKAGDAIALSYALLITAGFNPSQGITLEFTTHKVLLRGRNLRSIYRAIVDHRLAYLQEFPRPLDDQPETAVVVTTIQCSPTA
ncbi:hypothetical protein GC163_24515 [bacterium]|nr:hypothetical protein [bacterium]